MNALAVVRPDDWNLPLFVHVFGAMVLVGGLFSCAGILTYARGDGAMLRLGYWSLLGVSLPGWLLMRIGAGWIYSREGWDELPAAVDDPSWLAIGYVIADIGGLVLLVALIIGGVGAYRLREEKGAGLLKVTLVLSVVLLAAYLVAVWAMAGKPN
jgi:hypothetical protein